MFDILSKKANANSMILCALMILYIISDIHMPQELNELVNSNMGAGVLIIGSLALFSKMEYQCCAVIGFLVVYEMMRRAKQHYRDNRIQGASAMSSVNRRKHTGISYGSFGYSLEEGFVHSEEAARKTGPISMGGVEPLLSNDKGNYASV